jgi:hypothetical protein
MLLGVAIRAEQNALAHLASELGLAPGAQRAHVQFEPFPRTFDVMPRQRGMIAVLAAATAAAAQFRDQPEFSGHAPGVLRTIVLVAMIRVAVLAPARAVFSLLAGKLLSADETCVRMT